MCDITIVPGGSLPKEGICPNQALSPSYTKELEKVIMKVKEIALFALKALACAFLFWLNPLLLAGAFFVGSKWSIETKAYISNVERVWNAQPCYKKALVFAIGALALPVTIGAASVLLAADAGATLFTDASEDGRQQRQPVILTV